MNDVGSVFWCARARPSTHERPPPGAGSKDVFENTEAAAYDKDLISDAFEHDFSTAM